MKYYRLKLNFDRYTYYKKDIVYREDVNLKSVLEYNPNDWEEVKKSFQFGKPYIYIKSEKRTKFI